MIKSLPYGRQDIQNEDIKGVIKVLKSDWLTQGPTVEKFEKKVTKFCKSKFSIASNSATSALHISCLALGVGKNDKVWTSSNSFVASANCALYCGAKIDFIDIDPRNYNMCPESLEIKLKKTSKKNLPKVVIPVHMGGLPCDMIKIYKLSKKYNFRIIEDASHAIGARYGKNQKFIVGNCQHSDITVFSFHPVKIITTGEGGMSLTNNQKLYEKMQLFRSHGITKNKKLMTKKPDGPWYYQQINLGYNYRMNDIEASLGIEQLKRVKSYIRKRNEIAKYYNKKLHCLPINLPKYNNDYKSSYHLYIITIKKNSKKSRNEIFRYLRKKKILANVHYIPIHTQPFFKKLGFTNGYCPNAENYYYNAISLPIYPKLKKKDQDFVIKCLYDSFK